MTESENKPFRRRQYFINSRFQAGFILKFVAVLFLGGILSIMVTMLTTQSTLTSTFAGSRLVIEKTSMAILPSVIFTTILTILVVGVVVVIITLLVSHKIAGPMYRFEQDLEEISRGNLQKKVHIRNGDQFDSVARKLNEMVVGLNSRLRPLQEQLDKLTERAKEENFPRSFQDDLEECRRTIPSNFKL